MKILRPVPSLSIITQDFAGHLATANEYGYCSAPIAKSKCPRGYYYPGIDFVTSPAIGHPVTAALGGNVEALYNQADGYGLGVKLAHPSLYHTIYAHMSATAVKPGQRVTAGQLIGHTGWTGNVWDSHGNRSPAAAHLHFELRQAGMPIDPEPLFASDIAEPPLSEPAFSIPTIPPLPTAQVTNQIAYNINVRSRIAGPVVGRLPAGSVVQVAGVQLDHDNVWFLVITDNFVGWSAARYNGNDWIRIIK